MTTERMEGTEPGEQASPTDGENADATEMTQPDQPGAQPATAEAPTATAVPQDDTQQRDADAPQADAPQADAPPADAPQADAAQDDDTSDPSPEAAIGSSGAGPLGDAEQVSARVADAVDRMTGAAADEADPGRELSAEQGDSAVATATMERPEAALEGEPTEATPEAESSRSMADMDPTPPPDRSAADATDGSSVEVMDTGPTDGMADMSTDAVGRGMAEAEPMRGPAPTSGPEPTEAASPPVATAVALGPEPTTMEELLNEQPGEIRSLKHGDVVEGSVVRIDKDEILVDIGAKSEGVVSNRELYGRNAEAQPQLNIGDTVLVYVLQPESPEGHAVLSLRRAGLERKWRSMQEQLDGGAIIEAPVIDHNKGGLIVDCGIRGFVPISQIVDFPRRPQNEQPRDAAQEIAEKLQPYVGRKLRLKILEVNRKANRLILSEKVALYEERREKRDELFSSLQVGQKVTGTVRSIAPFGVFVDLGGIDGLVHKSELSWNKVNNPEAGYKVGEEVDAEVIDINHERGRISLSIRRLQPDPWHSTVADLKVGDVIDGTVTKIVNFGAFVRVRDGLEGLIHISELSHQRVVHPGDVVHEGQSLKLKIISLDSERHRLGLSLKQAEEAPARPAPEPRTERRPRQERSYDASQAVQEPEGGIDNTLAAAFAQVRQQMEETEAARRDVEPEAPATPVADESVPTLTEEAASADDAVREAMAAVEPEATAAPEAAAEPTAEAVAEPTTEAAAEPTAEAVAEPTTEAAAEPTAEAVAEPTTEAAAEPTAEAVAEPTTEAAAEPEATAAEPEAGAEPEAAVEPTAEAVAEPTTEAAAEPTTESAAEPEATSAEPEAASEAPAESEEPEAPAPAAKGGRRKAAKSEASAEQAEPAKSVASKESADEGEPVADSSAEPAEGAPEAAPPEGADREETAT